MSSLQLYRGLAHPLNGAKDIKTILERTKLNWTVEESPLIVQGTGLEMPHMKGLYRSDTRAALAATSDSFKVHQNEEIVAGLVEVAEAAGIELTTGGSYMGGAKIFMHG